MADTTGSGGTIILANSIDPRILAVLMRRLGIETLEVSEEEMERAGRVTVERTVSGFTYATH